MSRYVDVDKPMLEINNWRADLEETYGKNDEYVQCLKTVLGMIEDAPTADVIEVEKIIAVITRLRSNRESNLIRYTSNEGTESYVIRSQKDRGYFQALNDVEKSLLGRKEEQK